MRNESYLIETLVIYGALTLFAVLGVNYLAPVVGEHLQEILVTAANAE